MRYLHLLFFIPVVAHAAAPTILYDDAAKAYVANHSRVFSLSHKIDGVSLAQETHSLLGTHYYFQQKVKGIPIEDAEVVISVRDADKSVYRVYKNTVASLNSLAIDDGVQISENQAYDIAWNDLRVTGSLMSAPQSKLVYQRSDNELNLVYKVRLSVTEPFGHFEYTISAISGKILKKADVALTLSSKRRTHAKQRNIGNPIDRESAFAEYQLKQKLTAFEAETEEAATKADGQALVFDTDPRTTLKDNTLRDNSPPEKFEAAYVTRVLKDLTVANNKYILKGPWVQIADFEPPTDAASTTPDGNWNFKRGNNGFDDAMAYFHIDQSQRYIQSLGFLGSKGIQNLSIPVDSDGVNGDDNSHFIPGDNKIAFGHGCVNDAEDSDVILHEYGHALQDAMSRNWHGGDTGAMGEGFGDYWAASYSMSVNNGWEFMPTDAFVWDSGGEGNPCWPGRSLNVISAMYDSSRSYGAHQPVGNYESDELWSTPLFQSLRELMTMGYPRDRVDQIILEAHFGLGANLTMRDMAKAILQTATKLYPSDPYAMVFQKHFVEHNIIELPHAALELKNVEVRNAGPNNVLDPGENVELYVTLANTGTLDARVISARVSSSNPNVTLNEGDNGFVDLAPGAQGVNASPIRFSLSRTAPCGDEIELALDLSFSGGTASAARFMLKIPTGITKMSGGTNNHEPTLAIPDNDPKGATSAIWLNDEGSIVDAKGVTLSIDLQHKYVNDLKVTLIAPSGKEVVLYNHESTRNRDLIGTYPLTLKPTESFSKLAGEGLKGEWKLKMVDNVSYDKGMLKKWGFSVVTGHQCTVQD